MNDLQSIIARAREGDADAYAVLVQRFQDMAVGYGYSLLRDLQRAEDASQEAFLEAFRNLGKLREPAAFPGWFRRIVFKQCNRILRSEKHVPLPIDEAVAEAAAAPDPSRAAEILELKSQVLSAVDRLPAHERATILLFYMSGYSHKEVGRFLGVPVSTVKKRLHSARARMRDELMELVQTELESRRPSRTGRFASMVVEILKAARAGDTPRVRALLEQDPRLLEARDPFGNTALIMAVNAGKHQVVELLFAAGVQPDIHEAAAIGMTSRVEELLREEPRLVDACPEAFTPLALAAHFGHIETAEFLIAQGADVNAISRHELKVSPLHAAMFGRREEMARLLVRYGADVRVRRGGKEQPRSGWTPLHYAAGFGMDDLIEFFIGHGADPASRDDLGRTPIDVALEEKRQRTAEILRLHSDAR